MNNYKFLRFDSEEDDIYKSLISLEEEKYNDFLKNQGEKINMISNNEGHKYKRFIDTENKTLTSKQKITRLVHFDCELRNRNSLPLRV